MNDTDKALEAAHRTIQQHQAFVYTVTRALNNSDTLGEMVDKIRAARDELRAALSVDPDQQGT